MKMKLLGANGRLGNGGSFGSDLRPVDPQSLCYTGLIRFPALSRRGTIAGMSDTGRRWYLSEPVIVTAACFTIVLAASAGFWLMAVTWPAAPIIGGILVAVVLIWFAKIELRMLRKRREINSRVRPPDHPVSSS